MTRRKKGSDTALEHIDRVIWLLVKERDGLERLHNVVAQNPQIFRRLNYVLDISREIRSVLMHVTDPPEEEHPDVPF